MEKKKSLLLRSTFNIVHGAGQLLQRAIFNSLKPEKLWFGVTDRCNSRCKSCDIWKTKPTRNELMPEEIEKILSDPIFKNVDYIINSGGEPTCRADLKEVIMAEHKALPKAKIQISTNGLLAERAVEAARYALQNNINIDVGTSLDGIGEKHDFARGVKGNFEKTNKMLQEMVRLQNEYGSERIGVSFGFTLTDYTACSLKEVTEYSKKIGVPFLVQWFNRSSFYNNEGKDSLDKKTEQNVVRSLPFSVVREMWLQWLNGKSIKFPCFAMYTFCVLKCNGDISPCLSLWDVNVGNVREKSPTEIWLSQEAREARKTVKDCQGCLNSWGTGWSFMHNCYIYKYYLRHPGSMVKRFKEA